MMGNISHQWRHPLSELSGNIMNLETKRKLGHEINLDDYIKNSKQVINFMSDTIETFYNFYKDRRQARRFCINDVIEETLLILKGSFELSHIKVQKDLSESFYLDGNPNEIKQVMLALFVNAKSIFSERKTPDPTLMISLHQSGDGEFSLEVSDNGGGIEDGIIDKIFDLHFSNTDGSGIGLYITKQIIEEKFNGNIEVQNYRGGVRFVITFFLSSISQTRV